MARTEELTLPITEEAPPDPSGGSIFFIGTATVILRYAGFTILTDPNFLHAGDHVHLGYGMTAERLTNPAIEIEQLPPIDFCLLSHYHGDHFDRLVERKLRKDLPILTTGHATRKLRQKGFTALVPHDTWQSTLVKKGAAQVRVTAMPARHGPPVINAFLPAVMGSMLEFQPVPGRTAIRLYISGDTLLREHLREIPRRYPDIDIGLFHLGGTRVLGILLSMDAAQGVEAIKLIGPREAVPIHYDDYDVFKSPFSDFKREVEKAGLTSRVRYLGRGETYRFEVPAERLSL